MQHPDEGTIHAWLDGALSPEEAAGVEAHVNECAQCQSAVAEARGFIAASSRILTALDNVPRGVVPAAQPKRGIAPWVWRVAATVLVVAAGTLVVVRRTGVNQSLSANAPFRAVQRSTDSSRNSESAASPFPAATAAAPSIQRAETSRVLHDAPAAAPRVAATRPADAAIGSDLKRDREQNQRDGKIAGSNIGVAERSEAARAAAPPPAMAPTSPAALPQRFGGVLGNVTATGAASAVNAADMAVVAGQSGVRAVGNRRASGQKITLYEVAPGDTVELAEEATQVQLQAAVATGASAARRMSSQPNMQTAQRATGKVSSSNADASAPPPAPPAAAPTPAPSVNRITWTNSAGRVVKLSGRHTPAELEQIRRRIELLREASRADSVKKNR
ncbi:MAG: anti-sigma factor family protein [Gemmatimonadaceae bacterium]